jgi:hypothetical protein
MWGDYRLPSDILKVISSLMVIIIIAPPGSIPNFERLKSLASEVINVTGTRDMVQSGLRKVDLPNFLHS